MNHNGKERSDEPTESATALLIENPMFPIGFLTVTRNANESLPLGDIQRGLQRHVSGDWGELCEEDRRENELSLKEGYRLFSAYDASNGTRFWIITEWDRSVTTVLLPEDY